jgi:hypothetical protein
LVDFEWEEVNFKTPKIYHLNNYFFHGDVRFDWNDEIIIATTVLETTKKNQDTITIGENQTVPYELLSNLRNTNYARV